MVTGEAWRKLPSDAHAAPLRAALALKRASGAPGGTRAHRRKEAAGLRVCDIVCTCGPRDRVFEERDPYFAVAVVVSGTFAYRGSTRSPRSPARPA